MSDAYIGEVRIFGGWYAPAKWHFCDGTLLSISSYTPLYSLIGTTYGGDGRTTFALPDLRGRLPVDQGQGTGLTSRVLGQTGGSSTVALTDLQMPTHNHDFHASSGAATTTTLSSDAGLAATKGGVVAYAPDSLTPGKVVAMANTAIGYSDGGNGEHTNLMPYQAVNYIICLDGLFPSFS